MGLLNVLRNHVGGKEASILDVLLVFCLKNPQVAVFFLSQNGVKFGRNVGKEGEEIFSTLRGTVRTSNKWIPRHFVCKNMRNSSRGRERRRHKSALVVVEGGRENCEMTSVERKLHCV